MELPKEDGVQAQPGSKRFYALEQLGDLSYSALSLRGMTK